MCTNNIVVPLNLDDSIVVWNDPAFEYLNEILRYLTGVSPAWHVPRGSFLSGCAVAGLAKKGKEHQAASNSTFAIDSEIFSPTRDVFNLLQEAIASKDKAISKMPLFAFDATSENHELIFRWLIQVRLEAFSFSSG